MRGTRDDGDEVAIPIARGSIAATWTAPAGARGVVVFAHGSGSSRHSPRNQAVARALEHAGLATLLADLLTVEEERIDDEDAALRFDIPFLARRVVACVEHVRGSLTHGAEPAPPIGLFGASTGAAAALVAAAALPDVVRAVVSRGGRPDLAGDALAGVVCPTLLLVGGRDDVVLELNARARDQLADASLVVIPGATHLFPEAGALEQVAGLARDFFLEHLTRTP